MTQTAVKVLSQDTLAAQVVACCEVREYQLHKREGDINIIGIEGMNLDGTFNLDRRDQWNDLVGILSFNQTGEPHFDILCKATTEPGHYYTLINLLNPKGAARLDTGYHKQLWQVGTHKGYEALAQKSNTARLVRDKNRNFLRDDKITYEIGKGINLHTTKSKGWNGSVSPGSIGRWSAGCVVIYYPEQFLKLMSLVKDSRQYRENRSHSFDFILLWSRWLEDTNQPSQPKAQAISATPEDIEIMARTIWGEARGESYEGKVAIGWVIRNRASKSPKYNWSSKISQVCLQKFQFSCWNKNDSNLVKIKSVTTSDPTFKECLEIAKKVVAGELADISNGADHYYANYIRRPYWAIGETPVAKIGVHLFFRLV